MSTLLTPIITQIELDRDRFKDLVNGDELVTVSLESRTEKSIAGQIKERIDAMAVSLTDAVNAAETARDSSITAKTAAELAETNAKNSKDAAFSSQTAAEGARDQVLSDKADIDTWYSDIQTKHADVITLAPQVDSNATAASNAASTAQTSATEAASTLSDVQAVASTISGALDEPIGVSPNSLYPKANTELDATLDITLIGGSPSPTSDFSKFQNRKFYVDVWDTVNSEWVSEIDATSPTLSYTITANTLTATEAYRWKSEDVFSVFDGSRTLTYETRNGTWNDVLFGVSGSFTSYPLVVIGTPTVTASLNNDLSGTISGGVFNVSTGTASHSSSLLFVKNTTTNTIEYIGFKNSGDLENIDIPIGYLSPNTEYEFFVQYRGNAPEQAVSSWGSVVDITYAQYFDDSSIQSTLTTKRDEDDIEYQHVSTNTSIDTTVAKAFTVDRTVNPTLTLSTSTSTGIFLEVFVYVTGSTGTVTWPGGVLWDTESIPGGSEPTSSELGANWTVVSLQKFDTDWVGRVVAKG